MTDKSITVGPQGFRPNVVRREDFLRLERARFGNWLAVMYRQVLLGLLILEIPLQIDTYLFHDLDDAKFGAISGFNVSLTTICLILLYVQWLPRLVVESKPIHISKSLAVYFLLVAVSTLWATDMYRSLFGVFSLLQAVLIFTYLTNFIKSRADVMFVMKFLVIGLLVQSAMMIVTRFYGDDLAFGPVEFQIFNASDRITGSMGSPNVASAFIAMLLAPCLGLLLTPVSGRMKLLVTGAFVLGCCAIILTLSRGGWFAAALSVMILLTVAWQKRWLSPIVFFGVATAGGMLALGFSRVLLERLLGDDGGSAQARVALNDLSGVMIRNNPFGVGVNNWDLVAGQHAMMGAYREEWFYIVHNKYLLVLSETGWFGLITFLAFLISVIACGWSAVRQNDKRLSPLALGLTAAFIGQMAHFAFDVFNSRVQMQMIFVVAAVIVAIFMVLSKQNQVGSDARDNDSTVAAIR